MTFRDLRIRAGFESQQALAEATGVHQTTIGQIELGEIEAPRYSTIEAIAKAFKISEQEVAKAIRETRAA